MSDRTQDQSVANFEGQFPKVLACSLIKIEILFSVYANSSPISIHTGREGPAAFESAKPLSNAASNIEYCHLFKFGCVHMAISNENLQKEDLLASGQARLQKVSDSFKVKPSWPAISILQFQNCQSIAN
jgi:hypothetical protein